MQTGAYPALFTRAVRDRRLLCPPGAGGAHTARAFHPTECRALISYHDNSNEDLKTVLRIAGIDLKPVVFLFVDTQIVNESMLEDINGILNTGDLPNLYAPEDMDNIMNKCRVECQRKKIPATKINIFSP